MTWKCALIQRWLPEYPDAEPSGWRKRLAARHLKHCPECRRELGELQATIRLLQSHPVPDPGKEFWEAFDRELHVKLAQVNQAHAPAPRHWRLPYYLAGAPVLVVLLLWLSGQLGPLPWQASRLAEAPRESVPAPASLARQATRATEAEVELAGHSRAGANHQPGPEKVLYAGIDEGLWEDDVVVNWEVDPVLADLSPQERETLARKLTGREP